MSTLPTYPWFDQVPDHLKTRNQLAEQGLRPGGSVKAQVVWKRGRRWADLYDVAEAKPKQAPTAAQLVALEKAQEVRRTCPQCKTIYPFILGPSWQPWRDCGECQRQGHIEERQRIRETASAALADPNAVILDTETTDLYGYVMQIAVIDMAGTVLLDTLVNPQATIEPGAFAVHQISAEMAAGAPTFAQILPKLQTALFFKKVWIYNAAFDTAILDNEYSRIGRSPNASVRRWLSVRKWECAMELYAEWVGDWSEYHGNYRWQPLPGGDHSAVGDARATLAILKRMAGAETEADDAKL